MLVCSLKGLPDLLGCIVNGGVTSIRMELKSACGGLKFRNHFCTKVTCRSHRFRPVFKFHGIPEA